MDVILLILFISCIIAIVFGGVFLTRRDTSNSLQTQALEPFEDETSTSRSVSDHAILQINSEIQPMMALSDEGVQMLLYQYVRDTVSNRLNTLQQDSTGKIIKKLKQHIDKRVGELIPN